MFARMPDYIPLTASGGVRVSIADAARFVQFHLNAGRVGGRWLLAPEALMEMYRQAAKESGWPDGSAYGLGVSSARLGDTYAMNHNGGGFGFLTTMTWLPEYGIGAVALTNSTDHPTIQAAAVQALGVSTKLRRMPSGANTRSCM